MDQNRTAMEAEIVSRTADAVVSMLSDLQLEEPVYAVILMYHTGEAEEFLPWVAVGTERERREFLREDSENADCLMWDGEALEVYDPLESLLEDMDFMDLCAQWSLAVFADPVRNPADVITALLQRICFTLQQRDLGRLFPVTDDFTVTASGPDGDWLLFNMQILLPEERFESFLKKGYLKPDACGCDEEPEEEEKRSV